LYHRLSVILIHVPSLNERRDDIPLLAERFLKEICEDNAIPKKTFSPGALSELRRMNWTGNIRELRNVIERLVILSGQKISEEEVQKYTTPVSNKESEKSVFEKFDTLQEFKDHVEKIFIEEKLKKNGWNVAKTSQEIDIQRSHLYNKIEKYQLRRSDANTLAAEQN
jgi:DNA-binding NtrC family response regulator